MPDEFPNWINEVCRFDTRYIYPTCSPPIDPFFCSFNNPLTCLFWKKNGCSLFKRFAAFYSFFSFDLWIFNLFFACWIDCLSFKFYFLYFIFSKLILSFLIIFESHTKLGISVFIFAKPNSFGVIYISGGFMIFFFATKRSQKWGFRLRHQILIVAAKTILWVSGSPSPPVGL